MSCVKKKKKIPIQLLSATTPEGKMEHSHIVVCMPFCSLSAQSKERELVMVYLGQTIMQIRLSNIPAYYLVVRTFGFPSYILLFFYICVSFSPFTYDL